MLSFLAICLSLLCTPFLATATFLPGIDTSSFVRSNFTSYDWVTPYAEQRGIFLGALLVTTLLASCCRCRCCCTRLNNSNNKQKYLAVTMLATGVMVSSLTSQIYSAQVNSRVKNSLEVDILNTFPVFNSQIVQLSNSVNNIADNITAFNEFDQLDYNISSMLQTVSSIATQVQALDRSALNNSFDTRNLTNLNQELSTDKQFAAANQSFAEVKGQIDQLRDNLGNISQLQELLQNSDDLDDQLQNIFVDYVNPIEDTRNTAHQTLASLGYIIGLFVVIDLFLFLRRGREEGEERGRGGKGKGEGKEKDKMKPNKVLTCCSGFLGLLFLWISFVGFSVYFVAQDGMTFSCQVSRFVRSNVGLLVHNQQVTTAIDSCFGDDILNISLSDYVDIGNSSQYNTDLHLTELVQGWEGELAAFTESLDNGNFSSAAVDEAFEVLNNDSQAYETPPVVYNRSNVFSAEPEPQHQETIDALMIARNMTQAENNYQTNLVYMQQLSYQVQTAFNFLEEQTAATENQLNNLFDPQAVINELQAVIDTTSCSFLGQQYLVVEDDVCDDILSSVNGMAIALFVSLIFQYLLSIK